MSPHPTPTPMLSTPFVTAPELAQRLGGIRRGGRWQAHCPAHEDTTPSLSLREGRDRYGQPCTLLKCHAGCSLEALCTALGITPRQLFAVSRIASSPATSPRHRAPDTLGDVVATYDYQAVNGTLLFQVVRYFPKTFRQRRPDPHDPARWIWNLKGIRPVLYRLPEILTAVQHGETIWIAEGEKDVHRLVALGVSATCNPMGAGKWFPHYRETLRGAHCIVLPDNDDPGRQHATQVAHSLHGVAASVKVLALPDLPPKGDVSDWIKAGGTAAALHHLAAATLLWTPQVAGDMTPSSQGLRLPSPDVVPYSDTYNAEHFAQDHAAALRYCYPWKTWLVWTGTHWHRDETGAVMQCAKQTIKHLALRMTALDDPRDLQQLAQHIQRSLSLPRLKAMVELAQSEPGMPILPTALDTDPWLLNCRNGTLDLRTGILRPHAQADGLTKCLPVNYDPQARCPTWMAFLARIMDGQTDLVTFLQRAVGYALTGDTSEHVLFLLHGTGRNGKSTFLETLHALLGDYAKQTDFLTFLARDHDTVRNDLADLQGARFVAAVEVEEGRRLAENLVKQVTGGDRIKARFLYQEYFEYVPQFKVFLACNHKPVIRGTDLAIWERIRLIPFTVTIPKAERDKHLLTTLRQELPGILAWAVQGCLDWQQHGLGEPPAVVQATGAYRAEMDLLGQFLEDQTVIGTHVQVASIDLYSAYTTWCEANGELPMSKKALGSRLLERGFAPTRLGPHQARGWQGLGLVTFSGAPSGEALSPPELSPPAAYRPPVDDPPAPLALHIWSAEVRPAHSSQPLRQAITEGATGGHAIPGTGPPATAPPDTTTPPTLPARPGTLRPDSPGPPPNDQDYEELLL